MIHTLSPSDFPHLRQVLHSADKHHARVILVGGAVRDALLGRAPHDLDFSVMGDPIPMARDVANALGGAFYLMDEERRIARVILGQPGAPLEMDFAQCRGDTWEDDLRAREFSINAMALDVETGELLDPLGGAQDLAARVVRMASPTALTDDPVRVLRATRMAQTFDATLDPPTFAAAQHAAPRLSAAHAPSAERIRDELMGILEQPGSADGIRLAERIGWLKHVAPEASPVSEETFAVLQRLADGAATLGVARLAALLANTDLRTADKRCRALKLSRVEMDAALVMLTENAKWRLVDANTKDIHVFYRLAQGAGEFAAQVAAFVAAQNPSHADAARAFLELYERRFAPKVSPAPLLTGEDVLALGVGAGPRVGRILAQAREAQMTGEIDTREQALALARASL